MQVQDAPFPAAWYGMDIPQCRKVKGTYERLPYDSLPPLPRGDFCGDFQWLRHVEKKYDIKPEEEASLQAEFERLVLDATSLGLCLPEPFLLFMRDADLRSKACLDCRPFTLPKVIVPSPKGDG